LSLILYLSAEEINKFNWFIFGFDNFNESFGGKIDEYCYERFQTLFQMKK